MSKTTMEKLNERLTSQTPEHIYPVKDFDVQPDYKVGDGDTIRAYLDLGFYMLTYLSCRIAGVDTPEKNTRAGQLVTEAVKTWFSEIPTNRLRCVSLERDKFGGRFLGTFVEAGQAQTLSHWLLSHGLARPYDGGKKPEWTDSELLEIERRAAGLIEPPPVPKVFDPTAPGTPEMN